jgi:N-acetylneuraminate lyase
MYAVIKEIIRRRVGIDLGTARKPLADIVAEDEVQIAKCVKLIDQAIASL